MHKQQDTASDSHGTSAGSSVRRPAQGRTEFASLALVSVLLVACLVASVGSVGSVEVPAVGAIHARRLLGLSVGAGAIAFVAGITQRPDRYTCTNRGRKQGE